MCSTNRSLKVVVILHTDSTKMVSLFLFNSVASKRMPEGLCIDALVKGSM